MRIPIDRDSAEPLYRQIESYFREGILAGNLVPDTRLPSSRQLARDLGVNRITVENAYAELEADGLIAARVGSGTYVLPPLAPETLPPDEDHWPLWQQQLADTIMGPTNVTPDSLQGSGAYSVNFASGLGDTALFPVEEMRRIIQMVLRRDGVAALEYGAPCGYPPLRRTITHVLASQGLQAHPDNVLITSGSQQALALVAQVTLKPGDVVLTERPTYSGALDLFRELGVQITAVPVDEDGIEIDKLERRLERMQPRLIYTMPNFQNPTGVSMSSPRRRQLLALADRYNVPVLEDDFVGDLRYEGRSQPALKALDPGGRVIYVSTFSKMLTPGIRVGFLVAEGPVYEALARSKQVNDLATSNLWQRALQEYVSVGRYQSYLRRTGRLYKQRRDAMLAAIERYLPPEVAYRVPTGGLFIWLRLPGGLSADALLPLAVAEGVTFAPGRGFYADRKGDDAAMRLNFAAQGPEAIEAGIERLGRAIGRLAG